MVTRIVREKGLLPLKAACLLACLCWSLSGRTQPAPGVGAPEIRLNDMEGKPFLLSALKGKVVLVDFWASWCMPCRLANPSLVRLHKKYAPKGLQVVSVSVDEDRQAWTRAVKADKLSWTQLIDEPSKSSAAAAYGVQYIPNAFLIDKKGLVRAVDAKGDKLEALVERLLGE
jgi:thiol-disulfide isomerase/thioredoxin